MPVYQVENNKFDPLVVSQELRRLKPISKVSCTSVATWSHPRAPNLSILTCAKDSHIWYALVICISIVFIAHGL